MHIALRPDCLDGAGEYEGRVIYKYFGLQMTKSALIQFKKNPRERCISISGDSSKTLPVLFYPIPFIF
jgi:hypothetical protein